MARDLSVVLPVYNEEGNIPELYARLSRVIRQELKTENYELIFVDDCSSDGSWSLVEKLHAQDARVRGVSFSRNFGHHLAITAGLDLAEGAAVVLMDSDLQDLPEEIPVLYRKYQEGFEVVYGIRSKKQFGFFKILASNGFNWLLRRMVDRRLEINTNIFRILDRKVVEIFRNFKEQERYVIGLVGYCGFRQVGVAVRHGERFSGNSTYDVSRMVRLAWSCLTSFSIKPLQLASAVGFFLVVLGLAAFLLIVPAAASGGQGGWVAVFWAVALLCGVQLIALGILGEYVGRILLEVKGRPLYVIRQAIR